LLTRFYYKQIWDSNDASIDVAQSAVDHWEATYNALRGLLVASVHSAHGLYGAAKAGANGLEHGLLVPVRDWVLLPAFGGVEHIVGETGRFLQSPQAAQLADSSLDLVRRVPGVGDNFLAPALVISAEMAHKVWQILQYPIPSRDAVRDSVDAMLTTTKWALSTAGREVYFYAKRMDASMTRTLMHTQWKVLGSGPYATLDKLHKIEVLDHICERYLSLEEIVERYELVGHIRIHNKQLYRDLVLSGLLRERGGDATKEDEWLSSNPSYRSLEPGFLIHSDKDDVDNDVKAVYFRLPYQNGKRPGKDVPWVRFTEAERRILELNFLKATSTVEDASSDVSGSTSVDEGYVAERSGCQKFPTLAQWYLPNKRDVLVDQKRHAISFLPACPRCRRWYGETKAPLAPKKYGELCDDCLPFAAEEEVYHLPPAIDMIMRPTFWRFHGPGDEVCRSVWFLDTKRHGLQPYSDESAAILEDAYLFLKWQNGNGMRRTDIDRALLTVQVTSPDGSEQQLVQFSSLTQATAIKTTLGGAISIFKRRVYRGIHFQRQEYEEARSANTPSEDGSLGNASFRSAQCQHEATDAADWEPLDIESANKERPKTTLLLSAMRSLESAMLAYPDSDFVDESEYVNEQTDHLVLIIHGIGEMLRSVDVMGMSLPNLSSIIDCCGYLRKNHSEVQRIQASLASLSGRVEYLPCEWHEAFALQSQRRPTFDMMHEKTALQRNATLNDISLRTIPNMRDFANDQLMDVLYFMSPKHHDCIMDIVATEMNVVVRKFRNVTGFGGKVSVIGHSLGSIVAWDLLANKRHMLRGNEIISPECEPETFSPHPNLSMSHGSPDATRHLRPVEDGHTHNQESVDDEPETYTPPAAYELPSCVTGPEHDETSPLQQQNSNQIDQPSALKERPLEIACPELEFEVENAFMLGSPIPVFLMIRNQQELLSEDFFLPGCKRIFNIFHPFDPIAYRLEPLIDPRNAETEPNIIPHWNGGYRVQYQTKRLWKRIVVETKKTQQSVMQAVEAQMSRLGLLDTLPEDDDETLSILSEDAPLDPICGSLNQGRRIDFMIQEKEIENASEYVAALSAHSSYWTEKDLSLFVARQIVRSTLESAWLETSPRSVADYETDA
jgi:DDHD domain